MRPRALCGAAIILHRSQLNMSALRVEGCQLHWAELGQGRPLVLLHGLGDSHRTWSQVAPALTCGRRVLMLDLAGHGLSERPDASYTLEWHSRLVGGWLEALGLEDVDLVGHSYGGGIALWMLRTHRVRIRSLTLVAAGGLGRDVAFALRLASIPYFIERFGQPFMSRGTRIALGAARGFYEADDTAWLSSINAVAGSARAFSRTVRDVIDWRGQHRHFRDGPSDLAPLPPIALLWGDRDTIIPITHAYHMAPLLGGASVTRFARCGHFPHRQQPKEFVRALDSFLIAPRTADPTETLPALRAA